MEQTLPSNIDTEILKVHGDLGAIAQAYKALAQTVQNQAEVIKELKDKYETKED
jgi:hypothetical protein